MSFDAAERICYEIGARLCDIDEFAADETAGSGCGHDTSYVWSRDRCDQDDGFFVHIGRLSAAEPDERRQCRSRRAGRAVVRCCADETTLKSDRPCAEHRAAAQGYGNPNALPDRPGGWRSIPNAPTCGASDLAYDVRGEVLPVTERCHTNVTFAEARTLCAANFARWVELKVEEGKSE